MSTRFTQLDGSPIHLAFRPFGFAVFINKVHACNPRVEDDLEYLGQLRRCAWHLGAGGEGWMVEASGPAHSHPYVALPGRVPPPPPPVCHCGGTLDGGIWNTPDVAALALANLWAASRAPAEEQSEAPAVESPAEGAEQCE